MQINLTQSEIVVALKNYISQQGINLYGKEVGISFTAGRKEKGISAEIEIEDIDLPQFGEVEPATLELVRSIPAELLAVQDNMVALANDLTGIKEEPEPVEEVPTKTTSLFG